MVTKEEKARVVFDAEPLAAFLVARRGKPLFPPLPPGCIEIVYSRRILEGVVAALADMGVAAGDQREYLARLDREGVMIEPRAHPQIYRDAVRDEGIRLAVTAGAHGYVSSDPEMVALKKWEGVEIMASVDEIDVEGADDLAGSADKRVEVFNTYMMWEIPIVINALTQAGIDALDCDNAAAGGPSPASIWGGEDPLGRVWRVAVLVKDEERAREVIASLPPPRGRAARAGGIATGCGRHRRPVRADFAGLGVWR